jgi:hypothetical protein
MHGRRAVRGAVLRCRFYIAYHTVYAASAVAGLAGVGLGRSAYGLTPTPYSGTFFAAQEMS